MTKNEIIARALSGEISKLELSRLLKPQYRQSFLDVCGSIEIAFTEKCGSCDACLADGCAMGEGEVCLNACLSDEEGYHRAIAYAWLEFVD